MKMTNTILVLLALLFVVHFAYAEKFSEYEDTAEHIAKTVLRRYERRAKSWTRAHICPCLIKYTKQIITFTFFLIKTSVFFAADACYALKVFFIFAAYFCVVIIGILGIVLIYSLTIRFCKFIHKMLFGQMDDGLQTPITSDNRSESTQSTEESSHSDSDSDSDSDMLRTPRRFPLRRLTDDERLSYIVLQQVDTQLLLEIRRAFAVNEQNEEVPNVEISDESSEDDNSTTKEITECIICCNERRLVKLQPCQHEICLICAKKLIRIYTARCPFCRSPIEKYAK